MSTNERRIVGARQYELVTCPRLHAPKECRCRDSNLAPLGYEAGVLTTTPTRLTMASLRSLQYPVTESWTSKSWPMTSCGRRQSKAVQAETGSVASTASSNYRAIFRRER